PISICMAVSSVVRLLSTPYCRRRRQPIRVAYRADRRFRKFYLHAKPPNRIVTLSRLMLYLTMSKLLGTDALRTMNQQPRRLCTTSIRLPLTDADELPPWLAPSHSLSRAVSRMRTMRLSYRGDWRHRNKRS